MVSIIRGAVSDEWQPVVLPHVRVLGHYGIGSTSPCAHRNGTDLSLHFGFLCESTGDSEPSLFSTGDDVQIRCRLPAILVCGHLKFAKTGIPPAPCQELVVTSLLNNPSML